MCRDSAVHNQCEDLDLAINVGYTHSLSTALLPLKKQKA